MLKMVPVRELALMLVVVGPALLVGVARESIFPQKYIVYRGGVPMSEHYWAFQEDYPFAKWAK